ncbi:MAG: CPBP family intramembrane metalloprotease [bacterium]|nr:CPBP family intramembrane metalloprotease [bacterium]
MQKIKKRRTLKVVESSLEKGGEAVNIKSFMGAKSLRMLIYPILGVMLLSAVSLRLKIYDASLWATVCRWYKTEPWSKIIKEYVLEAAVYEEIVFRGPAYGFLVASLFAAWLTKRVTGRTLLTARRIDGVAIHDIIAGILAVAGTYVWAAKDHPYPLPTFAMGLIFASIMIKTRNILWSIGAHAFINLCVIASAKLGGTMLY